MNLKIMLLFAGVFIFFDCFSQDHGPTQLRLVPIPRNVQEVVIGHWEGSCSYQSETKGFTLDVKDAGGRLQFFWSIYQTGIVSQKIEKAGYDTITNQIVLDGFLLLDVSPNNKNEIRCKLARHTFLSEFRLNRTEPKARNFETEDIGFNNGDVKLAGTLYKPKGDRPHPAIIFLHGSGPATRWEWAPYFAEKFAELGFASLIFDKRGCGESTGIWYASSLDDLSMDAVKALDYLKTRDDIEKDKIGMWGFSNSGWVVANALNFNNDISFIICVSGGGQTPREIERYGYQNALDQGKLTEAEKKEAMALVEQYLNYLADGQNRESLVQNIDNAKNTAWYPFLNLEKVMPDADTRKDWAWVGNWDPLPSIEKIKVPMLIMFGEADMQTEPKTSAERWKQGLAKAGNSNYEMITFKDANHGIRIGEHSSSAAIFWQDFAPGYVDTIMNWMERIKRQHTQNEVTTMFRASPVHAGLYPARDYNTLDSVKWKFHTQGKIFSSPAVLNGVAFVGSEDKNLYAINTKNGNLIWKFHTGGSVQSSPAVYNETVYFNSSDGFFYAVNISSGRLKWKFKTKGEKKVGGVGIWDMKPANMYMEDQYDFFLSSAVINNTDNVLFFGSGDGNIYALNTADGNLRWRFKTNGIVHTSPAFYNGTVYAGSWDRNLYAIDAKTGKEKWRFKTGQDAKYHLMEGIQSSPLIYEGRLYFGARDAFFYALDAETGKLLWKYSANGSWILTTAAAKDNTVYLGTSDSYLFLALDAKSGREKFHIPASGYIYSSPSISGNSIYFGDFTGQLFAIDLHAEGKILGVYMTDARKQNCYKFLKNNQIMDYASMEKGKDLTLYSTSAEMVHNLYSLGSILSSPVISNNTIYFGSADSCLYALKLKTSKSQRQQLSRKP
jgi:outer membrane protein assembly factor BamB/pimeloyl-ACP methyl ester carboxylesterase